MTRQDLIRKLGARTEAEYAIVAPFLEADLDAVDDRAALHVEIEAGRESARTQPVLDAKDVYERVRKALTK